jgi:hypothetical protein
MRRVLVFTAFLAVVAMAVATAAWLSTPGEWRRAGRHGRLRQTDHGAVLSTWALSEASTRRASDVLSARGGLRHIRRDVHSGAVPCLGSGDEGTQRRCQSKLHSLHDPRPALDIRREHTHDADHQTTVLAATESGNRAGRAWPTAVSSQDRPTAQQARSRVAHRHASIDTHIREPILQKGNDSSVVRYLTEGLGSDLPSRAPSIRPTRRSR